MTAVLRLEPSEEAVAEARRAASAATASAAVSIRPLSTVDEFARVVGLFERIWATDVAQGPINAETLRAIEKAGSYIAGAFDGEELVGACVGIFAAPSENALHSHIAGIDGRMRGRSVGFALKVHQRAWALDADIHEISWTFDPLISRNAHFNLVKLGAHAREYHQNYYGKVSDAINGADDTDRMLVSWDLLSHQVVAACNGNPARLDAQSIDDGHAHLRLEPASDNEPQSHATDAATVLIRLPDDIETMRRSQPATASRWRASLREHLGTLMQNGGHVRGFDTAHRYVIDTQANSTA